MMANLWPLVGVAFLGWSAFEIVFLYWCENVILGGINVLKMIAASPRSDEMDDATVSAMALHSEKRAGRPLTSEELQKLRAQMQKPALIHGMKLFLVPFFCAHYGGFCAGHGVFIFALLGKGGLLGGGGSKQSNPFSLLENSVDEFSAPWFIVSLVVLAGSHLLSFVKNFILEGEYKRVAPPQLMAQPYGRIIVLHVAILVGGFVVAALRSPVWLLIPLVAGKTLLDLKLHLREHEKLTPAVHPAAA